MTTSEVRLPGTNPRMYVLIDGGDYQIVRTTYYYESRHDRYGRYRVRRRAAVHLRDAHTGHLTHLWNGRWTCSAFARHPRARSLCRMLGVSSPTDLAAASPGLTLILSITDNGAGGDPCRTPSPNWPLATSAGSKQPAVGR
jgi:hypothetical protein